MNATAANAPTTADLTAAFIASGKTVTQCPPANAVPPSPQSAPVVPAKTAAKIKKAVAKTTAAAEKLTTPKTRAVKSPKTASTEKSAAVAGDITLASICADLNVAPKSARAILRRHMTKPDAGWAFDKKTAAVVRKLLTA
ncbi:hypothetical protein POLEWNIK_00140 [Brevundimonas phage vB_BpoS-Polewnik]|nr:hypothetical protein POLEWNIK_00140 [Brevundimonas phage vB_BpoS-Polewnik]